MGWDEEGSSINMGVQSKLGIPALSTGEMLGPGVFSAWST